MRVNEVYKYLHDIPELGFQETKTAAFLAGRFGVDVHKARIAGLLHDCAREFPNGAMVAEAQKRNIAYTEIECTMPLLLHAYIGARRIRECYGVNDAEIAQAIARAQGA